MFNLEDEMNTLDPESLQYKRYSAELKELNA